MVQKNLIIFLALLWIMPQFMAKRSIMTKFRKMHKVNYRQEDDPYPLSDDTRTNDNELHQQLCGTFKIDYLQEMDIITKVKVRLECKINITLPVLLPNNILDHSRGPVTSSDENGQDKLHSRSKRAIPLLAIT